MRFVRVANTYSAAVNLVATKIRGEPVYEIVKPVAAETELVVYYLPETPEELFFVRMRTSLYRQTMDSILEGNFVIYFLNEQTIICATLSRSTISISRQKLDRLCIVGY